MEKSGLQSQLASGLCSLVELRMATGDSEPDQVAAVCEPLLLRASQADAASPEPKQVGFFTVHEDGSYTSPKYIQYSLLQVQMKCICWYPGTCEPSLGRRRNLEFEDID